MLNSQYLIAHVCSSKNLPLKLKMPGKSSCSVLTLAVLYIKLAVITCQFLTTEYLDAKLPEADGCPLAHYDGEDSIYLLGGCGYDEPFTYILKFSISSETIQNVGTYPEYTYGGSVESDNTGNIFYFGVLYGDVYKFDPASRNTTTVARIPSPVEGCTTTKYNESSHTVLILGGWYSERELLSFDMETLTTSTISTNLPFAINRGTSVRVENKAYIFDDSHPNDNRMALEFDLDTYNMQTVGPPTLPLFSGQPSSVWDGNYVYIIGGYEPNGGVRTDGLIQFDPVTHENNFIPVGNFPVKDSNYFSSAPASIFVPSKNRIYFFGGASDNYTRRAYTDYDDIFYIDLTPLEPTPTTSTTPPPTTGPTSSTTLNPDFFTCNNRPNGFYPHPWDCSLYIGCQNEELTIFSCSPPLLFDPVRKYCNFPEEVECGTSCIDRPDGPYPHPHDCSLFIMCRAGSSNLFKCPPPLLFNPEMSYCDFPDLVTCSSMEQTQEF